MEKLGNSKYEPLSYINFYILILILLFTSGCAQGFPELNPSKEASTAPGKEWKPRTGEYSEFFPTEELAGVPQDLQKVINELTLSQLVDVALVNNPTTLQAWEHAKAAAAAWAVARGIYYPQLGGSAEYAYNKGGGEAKGLNRYKEQYGQVGATLNYLLLDFGGRSAQAQAARQALLNANWNHNQAIQDVLLIVASAYYKYIGNKAQTRADEVSLEEAKISLEAAELRLEAGVGTLPDVLQAKATMAQVQFDLVADRGAVETSRGALATAVGWSADTEFDVAAEASDLPLKALQQNVEDLIVTAKKNRPEFAAVEAFVRQREAELREAQSNRFPQLFAVGQIARWWVRPDGLSSDYFTNYLVGLQLQIPIFQGFALVNAVREARANLKAAQAALLVEEQAVIQDVWNAYYNFRTAAQQLEASEVLVASAKESYDASLARFRSGVGDIVELLNAQTLLAEARAEMVQSRTNMFTSYAGLVHAIGAELPSVSDVNTIGDPESATGTENE
ncbi:MAG: TolC family protein [Thermodesulfobacteriota bacterium]